MSLNVSKIILKIFGIISIIFGILGIIAGIMAIAGGALIGAGAATGAVAGNSQLAGRVVMLGFGGLIIIIGSVIELLSGVFSVRATKDISKIMPAWWFALICVIMSIISIIMLIQKNPTIDTLNAIYAIIELLISILIFVAANIIKKAARK